MTSLVDPSGAEVTGPADGDAALQRHLAGWLLGFSSANTRRAYRADLAGWLRFVTEHDLRPLAVRRAHVDAWARSLEAGGLAARTVARRIASVSSFYDYLVTEQCLADSPVAHVRRPAVSDRGETPGLTRDELRRLLHAAHTHGSPRAAALLTVLATTGLRINEALSRDVTDLGYDRGHRLLRLSRKGGRGDRTVLTAPAVRALESYLAGRTEGPLFCTSRGRRMGQPEAWRMVRRIARHAQLDGAAALSPHSLRVAFITGAREAGVPLEDVQDAAGHADPRTTRRYDRGRHSLDRHAAHAVAAWLSPDE